MPVKKNKISLQPARQSDSLCLFGRFDILILLVIAGLTLFSLPAMNSFVPDKVSVFNDNKVLATYPLTSNKTITINGSIGPMVIAIQNGSVKVVSSTCPHKICLKGGSISKATSQIVCAPNHILITITSKTKNDIDAIAR